MARLYHERLSALVVRLNLKDITPRSIEVRHFFSGAALYSDGVVCASLSPMGLAFRLPAEEVTGLIASKRAVPLRYFPKGNVKRGYALFESPQLSSRKWKSYFRRALGEVEQGTT